MALDQKDLSAIATALSGLLAPQMREVVSELVTVHVEAATQGMRESHELALAQFKELAGLVESERHARGVAFGKAVEEMDSAVNAVRTYVNETLGAVKLAFENQIAEVADKLLGLVAKEELETTKDGLLGAIDKVADRIPEVPPPTVLVEAGELSPAMREVMGLAVKQIFEPMLASRAEVVEQYIDGVGKRIDGAVAGIEIFKTALGETSTATTTRFERVETRIDGTLKELGGKLTDADTRLVALSEHVAVRFDSHDKRLTAVVPEASAAATAEAKSIAVDIVNHSGAEVKVQIDELRKETRITISEAVNTVPMLVEAQTENMLKVVLPKAIEAATTTADTVAQSVAVSHDAELKNDVLELARDAGLTAAQEHLKDAVPVISQKVHDSVVEKTILEVLEQGKDAGKTAADSFLASIEVIGTLKEQAYVSGREAGADAGMKAAAGMIPAAREMAQTTFNEALPAMQVTIVKSALHAAGELLKAAQPSMEEYAKAAGAEAGAAAALNTVPDLHATALLAVEESKPALLGAARESGEAAAKDYITVTAPGVRIWAIEAGTEAGGAAALKAIPEIKDAMLASFIEYRPELVIAAQTASATAASEIVESLRSGMYDGAVAAGAEAGAAAALKAIPELRGAALSMVSETEPALLAKAGAEGAARAADIMAANHDMFIEDSRAAGSEAGMAAAVKVVPDAVQVLLPGIISEARASAATVAEEVTTKTVNGRWDEVKEAAVTVAVAKALHATGDAVPALVAAQADVVGLLVQPGATQAATTAAKAIGEAAVALAREHAATAATAAATAATGALRDQLLADLDPTERVHEAVEAKVATVSKELGEAIADAVESHVKEELPKLHVMMIAKIQAEVDRLPIPQNGKPGKNGKDARIEPPYPYVEGKMYEQGSWTSYEGSVWVAARHTDLKPSDDNRDWYCTVPGVKNITATLQPDLRTLCIVTELGGGILVTNQVRLEIPVARGVYVDNAEYSKRDIVTYDGSWWEALKDGALPLPGLDKAAWKLQIKHGANAPASKTPSILARPVLRGDWALDTLYQAGEQVDHAGYRWMALKSTRERPPFSLLKSNDIWTMLGASV